MRGFFAGQDATPFATFFTSGSLFVLTYYIYSIHRYIYSFSTYIVYYKSRKMYTSIDLKSATNFYCLMH